MDRFFGFLFWEKGMMKKQTFAYEAEAMPASCGASAGIAADIETCGSIVTPHEGNIYDTAKGIARC